MGEFTVKPGEPWINVGWTTADPLEVRTDLDDPLGVIRVRPAPSSDLSPDGVTGTAAPAAYKDVPVPRALDGEWNGRCAYWFRRGVDETDDAFQRAMEGNH